MLTYPQINPVAVSLGPLEVHWYGLMYVFGFAIAWYLGLRRANKPDSGWTTNEVSDLITLGMAGVILGARLGYVVFYNLGSYLRNPLDIFKVWDGGMSFHGGLIGVLIALYFHARRTKKSWVAIVDFVAPIVPPGLFFGRIGNFINAELLGRPTQSVFGMIFPGSSVPRYPSQLFEAALEGVLLFIVLYWYSAKPRARGRVSALFGIGYGVFRFMAEFTREPDAHLGFIALGWLTMGQLLCLPLIILGILLWWYTGKENNYFSRH